MRKYFIFGIMALFMTAFICSSCSRKGGYYPHKKSPKKDCGCGGFGYADDNIATYE